MASVHGELPRDHSRRDDCRLDKLGAMVPLLTFSLLDSLCPRAECPYEQNAIAKGGITVVLPWLGRSDSESVLP